MDEQARAAYEDQSVQIRADLKKWEGDWATANGGKKPGRADIKQNPDIAHKYKQYNKLRDILAGKIPPPLPPAETTHGLPQRKRSQSDAALPPQTPSKRSKPAQTPQKTRHLPAEAMSPGAQTPSATHPAMTPSSDRNVLTPVAAAPTSISPTPQRDGRVLGIFDLLGRTPSKPTAAPTTRPAATPSKLRTVDTLAATTTPTTARFASTPKSTRTTQLLFQTSSTTPRHNKGTVTITTPFKTPSTNRISKDKPPAASTPTSSTPSFLRRRTVSSTATATTTITTKTKTSTGGGGALSRVEEQDENGTGDLGGAEHEDWKSVGPLRLPRKLGVGKGLSSVVAGLRRMEEEAFGDEEEAMREMEMEMMDRDDVGAAGSSGAGTGTGAGAGRGAVEGSGKAVVVGEVEGQGQGEGQRELGRDLPGSNKPDQQGEKGPEEEGQPGGLLSAFDNEALYDSLDEEKQRYRQPLRQFKKRGQKRTTRLVNMRPTRSKRPAQAEGTEADEDEDEDEVDMVPETQFTASKPNPKPTAAAADGDGNDLRLSDFDSASEIDFDASDSEEEDEDAAKAKAKTKKAAVQKKKAAKAGAAAKDKDKDKDKNDKGDGVIKKAVRKVKATAHANFKRLKLRNTGTKGGPGFNSRFRRRR